MTKIKIKDFYITVMENNSYVEAECKEGVTEIENYLDEIAKNSRGKVIDYFYTVEGKKGKIVVEKLTERNRPIVEKVINYLNTV